MVTDVSATAWNSGFKVNKIQVAVGKRIWNDTNAFQNIEKQVFHWNCLSRLPCHLKVEYKVLSAQDWDLEWGLWLRLVFGLGWVCAIAIRSETSLILKWSWCARGWKTDIKLLRKTLRKWKMVLYERHIQVSVLNLINAASLRVEFQWRTHLSGCPCRETIVPMNPTSFCDVLKTRVKCGPGKRDGHGYRGKAGEWSKRRRRSSGASPILMRFFDRPWNYAWWFLKCFNWSGPKLKLESGRQTKCLFLFSRCKSGQPN